MDITQIIVALIGLLGVIITSVVVPYIKSKTTAEQWLTIKSWTITAVNAAEVIFKGAGKGAEKREYVLNYIQEKCDEHNIIYDKTSTRNALENAWKDL